MVWWELVEVIEYERGVVIKEVGLWDGIATLNFISLLVWYEDRHLLLSHRSFQSLSLDSALNG